MFLTCLIATHVSILTSDISKISHEYPFTDLQNAPLPRVLNERIHNFGTYLEPRYIFGAGTLI